MAGGGGGLVPVADLEVEGVAPAGTEPFDS